MTDNNPYAPPQVPVEAALALPQNSHPQGIWRQGRVLVMHKGSRLPDRCVKSNQPSKRRLRRKMTWHHPLLALSILVNLLLYIVLALVFRESAQVEVPLSEEWFSRRTRRIIVSWLLGLTSLAAFIGGFFLIDVNFQLAMASILGGLAVLIATLIIGQSSVQMVHPKKITKEYVWLKGVNRDYLDTLPEWPNYPG